MSAAASHCDAVAHDLLKVAFNPDRLRALLAAAEAERPGTLYLLERQLAELTRNL